MIIFIIVFMLQEILETIKLMLFL